ncbi:copper chaperone SCO1/SenC family protein [Caenibius tardaugens NBRC 16725]|uniref:Copper chaperone SCO1/SenC family protein n=2 Tax=Caenibius TaxID=2827482 RepID=U3A2T1_9SPHN|nr:SCO family protein [Caenibius tardaugens]AZI35895.1 SCO family protein [Caenibius tardaugens NBRC 16725]TXG94233.1 MAG: SCO family protein [Rhodocyclaceae bacterium]GAD49063.1 copper chaperone SCO1/SenC family protein [Caenibius tardaugens NBRC 16725]
MNPSAMIKHMFPALCLPLALVLAGCEMSGDSPTGKPPLEGARIGGPFTLVDKNGKTVKWSDFDGRYRIVYFGYAYCPDVCPFDMQKLMQGFAKFAKAHPDLADDVQPIFITIDPARDTPQVIGEFTSAFSDRLLGLTGTNDEIKSAAKAFGVYYAKGKTSPGGGYLMDHTRGTYLMGRKGEPIALVPIDGGPDAVAADLAKWIH